jgi:hypothetical protein
MNELLCQFINVRDEFLETVQRFPAPRRSEVLFGEWSIKEVIAHLTQVKRKLASIEKDQAARHLTGADVASARTGEDHRQMWRESPGGAR